MRIIFVHGFLGSALNWGPVLTKLNGMPWTKENGLRLESYDLLGHGFKSQKNQPNLSVDDLGKDLLLEIQKNSINENEEIYAVGHSFGIRPLLWICKNHPKLIQGLVVEDSSPVVSEQGFRELNAIFDQIKPPFKTRLQAKEAIEKIFGLGTKMSRFLLTGMRENEAGVFDWRFDAVGLKHLLKWAYEHPQWKEWENFSGPIAMIMGEDSGFVSKDRQQECLDRRKNKQTKIIQIHQAAHWVHSDQLDLFCGEVVKIVSDWLPSQKS